MNVLSLNPGSSSLKFALHGVESAQTAVPIVEGLLDQLGTNGASLRISDSDGIAATEEVGAIDLGGAVHLAIAACSAHGRIDAVGCRVVHGGNQFRDPVVADAGILDSIRALAPLAPLHNALAADTMASAQLALPTVSIVAVFDTGFHQTLPETAWTYAIPRDLAEEHHLRRYGFHGISYRYVANRLIYKIGVDANRLVVCHLGNGASVCAILDGKSIDTSMGMTPLEGLVMGTRSGDIDPGLILFLEHELGMSSGEVDELLNKKSGLAGISGIGPDLRTLELAASKGDQQADLALEVFSYRVAKYIGGYAVALEGLNAVAFCGGIGENSPDIRSRICRRLNFLGLRLNPELNTRPGADDLFQIDAGGSASIWVVKTDEDRQIAFEAFAKLA